MIQNKTILEKLESKTKSDFAMKTFIEDIFNRESEGKHFTNYYKDQIAMYAKQRMIDSQKEK